MSELGPIKPLVQPVASKPLNRDDAKKDGRKKKKGQEQNSQQQSSEGHINEYI